MAPEVEIETCSKQEARIYSKLPNFSSQKPVREEYDLYVPNSESVVLFNSKFESGNLQQAIRQTEFEYVLYLDADTNSQNFSQWFYFSCLGRQKGTSIKLSIVNLLKVDSLYNQGMQVCCFSMKKYQSSSRVGWHRAGYDFKYFRNKTNSTYMPMRDLDMMGDTSSDGENQADEQLEEKVRIHYTMSFRYTFENDDDIVFFSHFYPYTLRDLETSLENI